MGVDDQAVRLLLTADDRTGALESGGAIADLGWETRFLPQTEGERPAQPASCQCRVLDMASRHGSPAQARQGIERTFVLKAQHRCHKMDSGLRGNWAVETAAFVAAGHRVAVVPSFPDAGRRCVAGTMFIHDVPVAESAFGRDPRNRLHSSRPADYLTAAGAGKALANGELVVLNAADNAELDAVARQALAEERLLVGTTGGIGAYVAALAEAQPQSPARLLPLPRPALIVCGSLHPLSRQQIAALPCRETMPNEQLAAVAALARGEDVVLTTPQLGKAIDAAAADAMAARLAAATWAILAASEARTLIIAGGDTAQAILDTRPLRILGSVDTGVPLCAPVAADGTNEALAIVTKGGGIGRPETLAKLLERGTTPPPVQVG